MIDDFVSVRRVGDAEIAVVSTGLLHVRPQSATWLEGSGFEVDDQDRPIIGINPLVVRTGGATIVVDPSSWSVGGPVGHTLLVPQASLDHALAFLGIPAEEVTHVVVTHGHWDHYPGAVDDAGRSRFPNAEHLVPAADWPAISGDLEPLDDRVRLVSGDVDLGDGVSLWQTPGETEGHQIVRVESGGERVYYLGDLFHVPAEFRDLTLGPPGRDLEQLEPSRRRVLEDAEPGAALLVFTHGVFPAWGTVDEAWRWRYL